MELYHNQRTSKFIGDFDGKRVEVSYRNIGNNIYELMGTFVPADMRGQGYGKTLVRKVLQYAKKNHLNLKISCPFIRHLISRKSLETAK